jgi:hypothetical protein
MDSLITAAARALAAGDPLGALNRVALRDDAPNSWISFLRSSEYLHLSIWPLVTNAFSGRLNNPENGAAFAPLLAVLKLV